MKKLTAMAMTAMLTALPLAQAQEAEVPAKAEAAEGRGRMGGRGPGAGPMQDRMKEAWAAVDKEACFKALDANGDGNVSKEEFSAANLQDVMGGALREAMRKAWQPGERGGAGAAGEGPAPFKRLDKNGDGKIAEDEFPRGPEAFKKLLERADKDGDGFLSEAEFKAGREAMGRRQERRAE